MRITAFGTIDRDAFLLTHSYCSGLADLAASHAGQLPAATNWPLVIDRNDSRRLFATDQMGWQTMIPPSQRCYLPSAQFALDLLQQRPYRHVRHDPAGWSAMVIPTHCEPRGLVLIDSRCAQRHDGTLPNATDADSIDHDHR